MEITKPPNNNKVQSLTRLMDCFLSDYKESETKKITSEQLDALEGFIEPFFLFSLVWSIGCITDFAGREKFNVFFRNLIK